ncbi:unnamed protein product [Menidia menidia]|uniref:Parvalbumin n=1 Tax=Menidia menidia TaxID=238744 RepID=A0A8S4AW41_9TELE|nr:unnamed protein product [Menidia menidia]
MSLTSILSAEAIESAVKDCQGQQRLHRGVRAQVRKVFPLTFFLQRFVPGARTLTEAEAKSFISSADDNSDGKIGADEFQAMVLS